MHTIDYDQYADVIERMGSEISASESHGILCGMLCSANNKQTRQTWNEQLLNENNVLSPSNTVLNEFNSANDKLYQDTFEQMNNETLEFSLLFPNDDESLSVRTEALAKWCQGFTYGLALGGFKQTPDLSTDVLELIRDFSEIAKAASPDDELDDDEEGDEEAFIDVAEYVRVGTLLILEELNPIKQSKPVLH